MLRLYAPSYLTIARICEEYTSSFKMMAVHPRSLPDDEQMEKVLENFRAIREICARMQLRVSERSITRTVKEFENERPTFAITKQKFLEWYSCFQSEVEGQIYLLVLPHRVPYWSSAADGLLGDAIKQHASLLESNFPDAVFDLLEAGNCFAFERFTACVYHLMRVAEFALVSVARSADVPEDRINRGWDGCIQGIESAIKRIGSTKPTTDWQERIKKLSDLCSWFTTIQKGWRNPVSHIPRTYSEGNALAMFTATQTLIHDVVRQRLKQVAMPADFPLDSPEDKK